MSGVVDHDIIYALTYAVTNPPLRTNSWASKGHQNTSQRTIKSLCALGGSCDPLAETSGIGGGHLWCYKYNKSAKTLCNAVKRIQNLDNAHENTDYEVKSVARCPLG